MKKFTLKIWELNTLLHIGIYDFKTLGEAQQYHLGMVKGFELCGKKPNRMELREIKNISTKPNNNTEKIS